MKLARAREKKRARVPKTKWWKLAEPESRQQFATEATKRLQEKIREGTEDWENVTEDMRQLGEEILGKTSGKTKQEKETWWWDLSCLARLFYCSNTFYVIVY